MESELKNAVTFFENNKLNDAEKICLNIYKKNPKNFDNLRLLNFTYYKKKDYYSALNYINEAIKINPNFAETYNEQGNSLKELKKLNSAIKSYEQAIKINHNYTDAYYNKGIVLHELGKFELAIESYDSAIKLNPNHSLSHNNKGFALQKLNKIEDSLKSFSTALKINPNYNFLLGELIHTKNKLCNWDSFSDDIKSLEKKINEKKKISTPFPVLQLIDSPFLQKISSEIWVKEKFNNKKENFFYKKEKKKKIRIGYYSADFYNHAMSYLLAGLFELHDKSTFEIYAFSFGPNKNDEMSKRISKAFTQFLKVNFKTDKEVAKISRDLGIDIAVDLLCFTANNRIGIFSEQCAPIQINYLGYPGTSGTNFIDYIIADKLLIPKENQKYFSEKIIYLPDTYQVRDSNQKISKTKYTREELKLPKNAFVFCCFNQNYKITPNIFNIWMRLLKNVDNSVLWLLENNLIASKNLKKEANNRGIKSDRIIFAKRMPLPEHLSRLKLADLFIDTFPYGAHTTCSDALWTGLPVVTRIGQSFASRVAGSLLSAIDLKELVTHTENEYEKKILELAKNASQLNEIKNKLKKNRLKKPLFNTKLYTKNIELAYKKIYEKHLNKLPIENIEI